MSALLDKPVLLLIYRRPDTTRAVFEAVRQAKPRKLYVSAAGPAQEAEAEVCEATRAIIEEVDWSCEVNRNFMDENRGCRANVARGISWALEREDDIIVLEDDCVPTQSFFRFCSELLDRYRDDERVMSISGTNFLFDYEVTAHSYFWSRYPNIWGWATWRRAWNLYDSEMSLWQQARDDNRLSEVFDDWRAQSYWRMVLDVVADGTLDAWDFVWFLSSWLHGGLSAQPTVNLVHNIGFDERATHTKKPNKLAHMTISELSFPLDHPSVPQRNHKADRRIEQQVYSNLPNLLTLYCYHTLHSLPPSLKNTLRSLLGRAKGVR